MALNLALKWITLENETLVLREPSSKDEEHQFCQTIGEDGPQKKTALRVWLLCCLYVCAPWLY